MTHGDNQGLALPPRLAPIQVVVVPIFRTPEEKTAVMKMVDYVQEEMKGVRLKIDDREEVTPGYKFNHWELRGVPLRVEIGPKDVENNAVMTSRRDIPGKAGKKTVGLSNIKTAIPELLEEIQTNMLKKATLFRDTHIFEPGDFAEFQSIIDNGWAFSPWCGNSDCENEIKEKTKATIRCIPIEQEKFSGNCIHCGEKATQKAYFARSY